MIDIEKYAPRWNEAIVKTDISYDASDRNNKVVVEGTVLKAHKELVGLMGLKIGTKVLFKLDEAHRVWQTDYYMVTWTEVDAVEGGGR